MRYYVLVSHGTLAPGLHSAVGMMAGGRTDVLSTSLRDGMDVDAYKKEFEALIVGVTPEDEIMLFGDIVGGSPMTAAMEVLTQKGLFDKTVTMGGMNLPLIINALFAPPALSIKEAAQAAVADARERLCVFEMAEDSEDDI